MKRTFALCTLMLPFLASASGAIDFLEVDDNVVLFSSSEAKTTSSPACVLTENANLWSISLASDSGRAMYSLILTSMAKGSGMQVAVESAQDCSVSSGYERAGKVNLVVAHNEGPQETSGGYSIGVYKGDGVTRLGTLAAIVNDNYWRYIGSDLSIKPVVVINYLNPKSVFYTEPNCAGTPFYTSSISLTSLAQFDDKYFVTSTTSESFEMNSILSPEGVCNTAYYGTKSGYRYLEEEHPICGAKPCLLKQD